jgi:hypothetical protein
MTLETLLLQALCIVFSAMALITYIEYRSKK